MAWTASTTSQSENAAGGSRLITIGPIANASINNATVLGPVIDHDFDVEAVYMRHGTVDSADLALTARVAASGTAKASGTAIGSGTVSGLSANVSYSLGLSNNTGFKAGSALAVSGGSGLTTLDDVVVTFRITKVRRVDTDAGTRIYRGT